jgi:hypothetical protein
VNTVPDLDSILIVVGFPSADFLSVWDRSITTADFNLPLLKISSNEMLLDADAVRLVLKETAVLADQRSENHSVCRTNLSCPNRCRCR